MHNSMFENPSGKPTRGKLSLLRDWLRPARELHDFIFSVSICGDHPSHYSLLTECFQAIPETRVLVRAG